MRRALALGLFLATSAACGDSEDASSGAGAAGAASSATSGGQGGAGEGASGTGASGGGSTSSGGAGAGGQGGEPDSSSSPGCVDGRGIPEGESTFMLDGAMRRYIVHLPIGYTNETAWPVVLALHPNGGNIDYWNSTSGERDIRGEVENDAILVLAEDITNNWPDDLPTELAYFDAVLTTVKDELCVDLDEIFSMGFSGGGSFSGVLGCMRTDIRAIVSGGAIIYFEPADCVNTPAAWITIGEGELVPAREEFRDFWRDRAMCDATTTPTDPDPCVAYDNCAASTPVHYCQHPAGHVWPPFGTAAAWAFFAQFVDE